MKGFKVKLKSKEVKLLKGIIGKGIEKARKITRCRILLSYDAGKSKREIASMLCINPNTVSNTCKDPIAKQSAEEKIIQQGEAIRAYANLLWPQAEKRMEREETETLISHSGILELGGLLAIRN
jgi:hypothetical protein